MTPLEWAIIKNRTVQDVPEVVCIDKQLSIILIAIAIGIIAYIIFRK